MKIDELLSIVSEIARDNNISTPFMIGGAPRDRVMGIKDKRSDIKDIDITTGDHGSNKLALLLHRRLRKRSN